MDTYKYLIFLSTLSVATHGYNYLIIYKDNLIIFPSISICSSSSRQAKAAREHGPNEAGAEDTISFDSTHSCAYHVTLCIQENFCLATIYSVLLLT